MSANIQSEILPLKKVILHAPYESLYRLTPHNHKHLLFDDVIYPESAIEEHRLFGAVLKQEGVEVLYVEELLCQALMLEPARRMLMNLLQPYFYFGDSGITRLLIDYLNALNAEQLVKAILNGITFSELGDGCQTLTMRASLTHDFIIPPLPNQLFTRDSSFWIGNGVCLGSMANKVRHNEAINFSIIYQFHPFFNGKNRVWYEGHNAGNFLPSIEGGDVLVLSYNTILVGLSERTQPQAIEILAAKLFHEGVIEKIIAVDLPKDRAYMHLDTLITMVDEATLSIACSKATFKAWILSPGDKKINIEFCSDFLIAVAQALDQVDIKVIKLDDDHFTCAREHWTGASNLLALRPGKVISYSHNKATNLKLRSEGIEVITIAGQELSRGRGGPRCMTCPILRESI